ncbi:MAG: lytic transglycosylase domain-containing protein, partial [Gammaproteobacteria bacterium]|nr:lytic transglycosylase domain-containing protein [Gammaproteobacteria bacterium]
MISSVLKIVSILLLVGLYHSSVLAQQQAPDADFKQQFRQTIADADQFEDKFAAQVWLTDMSYRLSKRAPHIPEQERLALLALVHKEATRHKLNPQMVLSLIQIESNFDRFAISKVGARGLMQIMPFWLDVIGEKTKSKKQDNLFDIATNLRYGCAILSIYMKREKKEIIPALARYHGSYPRDYYSQKVIKAWQNRW